MTDWTTTTETALGGRFQIVATGRGARGREVDITEVRGKPTDLPTYSDADPFGDAATQLTFPAISPFDDFDAPDLASWLMHDAALDIYWVPALPADTPGYAGQALVTNPLTERDDLITPINLRDAGGAIVGENRIKVWEGFFASRKLNNTENSFSLTMQCQGALFQLDNYRASPFYPPDPWPMELLIENQFKTSQRPHLQTRSLITVFPSGWKSKVPAYTVETPTTPAAQPGTLWTALTTRNTGSWNAVLTGFVQDLLTDMITRQTNGVMPGNQWTVRHYRRGEPLPAGKDRAGKTIRGGVSVGRQPVLMVRDRFATPDFTLWAGSQGVTLDLEEDLTQSVDVIFGDGTDIDGSVWRNAAISNDGTKTSYVPLAADPAVYPYTAAKRASERMPREGYTKFGTGFSLEDGISISEQQLAINTNPGWQGTITLKTDPSTELPRWCIHSGMTVLLKGFAGTGDEGMRFHISQTEKNVAEGTVTMTVDTRYRDLLTVEESLQRTRDPLTPVKMLQVNKASVLIEDVQAPWDYSAGSGFIPTKCKDFFKQKPQSVIFPYQTTMRSTFPPSVYPQYYVKCNASARRDVDRWSGPVPILTSARDTIARTEFICVDYYGRPVKIPFHVSLYYVNVTVTAMPHLNGSYSPYQEGAFEKVDQSSGTQINPLLWPDNSFIIGWGNKAEGVFDRPGFYPGRESKGAPATGLFADDATWTYDNTQWHQYFKAANPPGTRPKSTDISIYAMIYAEFTEPVYFMGRLFRQNPGAGS